MAGFLTKQRTKSPDSFDLSVSLGRFVRVANLAGRESARALSSPVAGLPLRCASWRFIGISVIDGVPSEGNQAPAQSLQRGIMRHKEQQKILEPMRLGEGQAMFDE